MCFFSSCKLIIWTPKCQWLRGLRSTPISLGEQESKAQRERAGLWSVNVDSPLLPPSQVFSLWPAQTFTLEEGMLCLFIQQNT